jgi:hypothetical protein
MKNEIINRKTKTVEDFEIYLYILTYSYFVARGIEQVDLAPTDSFHFVLLIKWNQGKYIQPPVFLIGSDSNPYSRNRLSGACFF